MNPKLWGHSLTWLGLALWERAIQVQILVAPFSAKMGLAKLRVSALPHYFSKIRKWLNL